MEESDRQAPIYWYMPFPVETMPSSFVKGDFGEDRTKMHALHNHPWLL